MNRMTSGPQTTRAEVPELPEGPPRVLSVLRNLFRHGSFVAVVVVLCLAAGGLNASVQFLRLHFKKTPVPMRRSFLEAMPTALGTWVQVARDEILEPDVEAALATDKFLFCSYVDAARLGFTPDILRKRFEGKTIEEQKNELNDLRLVSPTAVVTVGLTYYTGKADTVAHIPERCYVGGGFDPSNAATERWGLGRNLAVRCITFESQAAPIPCNVSYFFHVNGSYESDSLAVRAALQNLFARYGYYAKVELMCVTRDRPASDKSMQDFLTVALPSIESALPEWSQYQSPK
jgi:hypothetical protein